MPVSHIVGSVNGIVCVRADNLYLWNPATKQYKTIPSFDIPNDYVGIMRRRVALGFGFDPIDNDLNREVLNCAVSLPVATFPVTVSDIENFYANARVTDFNASIAVIIDKCRSDLNSRHINLWALDDESCLRGGGIQASWTLMLNIVVDQAIHRVHGYLSTGDLMLLVEDVWALYNCETEEYRYFPDSSNLRQIFKCPESLVSIAGFKQVNLNPPDVVITKILLGLPFDSLLRFKSVSKSWLSLISSPNFAKSQLAIANTRGPDQIHIVHSYNYKDESDTSILLVDLNTRQIVADLNFPFSRDDFSRMPRSLLVGSACGIVCVHSFFSNASRIYLWNPSIKQCKRIPLHSIQDNDVRRVVLGFGFDPLNNDFKVVRIVSPSFSAEVYSANRNAWRNVESNPIDFPNDDNFDVCVNGFLYTAGRYNMIAFDLKTEVFNCDIKFHAPTFDSITEFNDFDPRARITEYNDSVAAIICKRNENDCKINLWALDDEACLRGGGIEPSWTLMLNIDVKQPVQFVHGYFNGGDFLLSNDCVWYLYNSNNAAADLSIPGNKEARNFMDAFYCGQMFRYTKSLFKIAGSKLVN